MFDSATLTISGNVVADPVSSGAGTDTERASFRVISNRRRRNPQTGEWEQTGEYGVNVVCWRKLARGVMASIGRGDPVLVIGRMRENEFVGNDGVKRWMHEVTADFVGADLSYGVHEKFVRFTKMDSNGDAAAEGTAEADPNAGAGDAIAEAVPVEAADPTAAAANTAEFAGAVF